MGLPDASGDLSSEMEVDAFRCLFPLRFYERHLAESLWPDGSPLGRAREASIAPGQLKTLSFIRNLNSVPLHIDCTVFVLINLFSFFCQGAVASADGSALAKIGSTVSASLSLSPYMCVCDMLNIVGHMKFYLFIYL